MYIWRKLMKRQKKMVNWMHYKMKTMSLSLSARIASTSMSSLAWIKLKSDRVDNKKYDNLFQTLKILFQSLFYRMKWLSSTFSLVTVERKSPNIGMKAFKKFLKKIFCSENFSMRISEKVVWIDVSEIQKVKWNNRTLVSSI